MPNVIATPRSLRNGEVITEFTDTTSTTNVTYTYPIQQAGISVENSGVADIFVTVGSYTNQVVNPNKTWKADVVYTSFSIRSNINSQEFTATAFQNDIEGSGEADSVARGMISNINAQLAKVTDSVLAKRNRALIISIDHPSYSIDWIRQMNDEGFSVFITDWVRFVKNIDNFVNQYELLLFSSVSERLEHTVPVTPAEVVSALTKWKSSGNKFINFIYNGNFSITKVNADGATVLTASYSSLLGNQENYSYNDAATEFVYASNYPFANTNILVDGRKPGVSEKRRYINLKTGVIPLVMGNAAGVLTAMVVYKPNEWIGVSYGGSISGEPSAMGAFAYVHVGKLAKELIGENPQVRLAFDCNNAKKIACSGYDGDVTTDLKIIKPIAEAYGSHRGLEFSLVSSYVTQAIANAYRVSGGEIVSHSKTHYTNLQTVTEEFTIPIDQTINLSYPYRVTMLWVKDTSETVTFSSAVFGAAINSTTYGYNGRSTLKFHSSLIGTIVKVSYTYLDEAQEWLGSIKELEQFGAITNKAIYLTAGYKSVSGATYMYCEDNDITLCDHGNGEEIRRNHYLVNEYYREAMVPLLNDHMPIMGFDELVSDYGKEDAKTTFIGYLPIYKNANRPFIWYSHDFWFSGIDSRGMWLNGNTNGWTQDSYENTVAYLVDFLKWYLQQFDNEGVRWMKRSDYVRFYNKATKGLTYSVPTFGTTSEIIVKNSSDKTINGVTFRDSRGIVPISVSNNVKTNSYNGETLLSVDLVPGETKLIRWSI